MEWKAKQKSAPAVGIIGLGYVGLPMAIQFARNGCPVTGFDVDEKKTESVNLGKSYIKTIQSEDIAEQVTAGRLTATADFSKVADQDAILICVPTPLDAHREPDLSYVTGTGKSIAPFVRRGQLISLESTTYPGTTEEDLIPILEAGSGLKAGEDFLVVFSPEREDPGNPNFGTRDIPKVIGGLTKECREAGCLLYQRAVKTVVPVSTTRVAEATKLVENIFRSVNIAMVNELKVVFERMGIDIWEVLDAAQTKPFGFMKFEPGPGLGGHCLAGEELVRVRTDEIDSVFELGEIFDLHQSLIPPTKIGDTEIIAPKSLETLSIDPETGTPLWKPVSLLFRRPFEGEMVKVQLSGNKSLHTTDGHPMLVVENDKLVIREAKSLASGERVPQFSGGLSPSSKSDNIEIDLIQVLPAQELSKLRVRLNNSQWETHSALLKSNFGWKIRDSIRGNSLSVKDFLAIEPGLGVQRKEITFLAGRGNSHTSFPGVLSITPDFCRFLGYYLSEGCITVEKGKCRIRLTFNRKETEFIQDVQNIMSALGITSSLYQDKNNQATTIRIGSSLLGAILKNVLNTGVGSTSMRIPDCVMKSSVQHHEQILAGLLRGDGNVEIFLNKRTYEKNGKTYTHEFNSGMVGYFSSSPKLFAQVEYLLNSMDLSPSRKAGSPQLRISGKENLDRMRSFFDGEKAKKLDVLSAARLRHSKQRKTLPWQGGKSVEVENITIFTEKRFVYSLEVPDTHTFATTGGVFVHNCIPIDPFYLTWKAREFGVQTKFIELAGEINTAMPKYVITRLMEALSDAGKPLKHSKVMILGLAYKKNVDDPRESPSFVLWDLLLERGADVCYHDPYIPVAPYMRQHPKYAGINSLPLTPENLAAVDAVLIATSHDGIDYTEVVRHARLVVDTRNACRAVPEEIKAGKLIKA